MVINYFTPVITTTLLCIQIYTKSACSKIRNGTGSSLSSLIPPFHNPNLAICFVCCLSVGTKITRSRHIGVWAVYKHNQIVKNGKNLLVSTLIESHNYWLIKLTTFKNYHLSTVSIEFNPTSRCDRNQAKTQMEALHTTVWNPSIPWSYTISIDSSRE